MNLYNIQWSKSRLSCLLRWEEVHNIQYMSIYSESDSSVREAYIAKKIKKKSRG